MAPKGKDSAWAHYDVIDGKKICSLCHKPIGGGGILRLKQHLAGIRGQVTPCGAPNVVLGPIRAEYISKLERFYEDKAREKSIQDDIARKRELLEAMKESGYDDYEIQDSTSIPSTNDPFHYVHLSCGQPSKGTKRTNIQSFFSSSANIAFSNPTSSQPSHQTTLDQHWKKQCKETSHQYIARSWYDSDIPFNVARSPYYQVMWDSVIAAGKGFKGPSMHDLRGALLQKEISSIDEYLVEFKDSWLKTGCSIMSDGWTDGKNCTIINFLVSCPQGTMFLRSVDASNKVKDAALLFELLDDIIQEVGEQNVVQVITDNASNYVLAGKMLESKYRAIFWTPCAAHCIDLMLEDIGKVEWVKNIVEHAKCITKYIYNHSWVLNLMRKNTRGKELVRPAITRFANHFLTLQCFNGQHKNLLKMFSSEEWFESRWAHRQDGKDTKKKVFDNYFWKRSVELVKITEPLVKVLRMVDGEKLAMGYIYEAMDQAKEQIRATYKDRLVKYGRIWEIIDNKWNNQLHRLIHAARYFLNPKYHYKDRLGDLHDGEVNTRLIDCLERMVPTHADQLEIHRQLTIFTMAGGTFGKNLAKMARDVDQLAHWWDSFGGQCPQLQRFAIRVLSQTCSASSCERNWSIFEHIHTKKRNCLEQKRLNDLVFVQYNLRLRRNQMMNKTPDLDPIVLDDIDPTSEWVEETEDPVFDTDFDINMALAGDEADFVAASEPGSVVASRKGKEPMEATSRAGRQTRASIRSTSIVIGGIATEVADLAETSSDSEPDDLYVEPDDDPVSSSGDELDD
eukprot:PITA_27736